jgi:hypothetical protein
MLELPCPEPTNRFPSCIGMRIHFEEVKPIEKHSRSLPNLFQHKAQTLPEIRISLSIQFSDQQELDIPSSNLPRVLERLGMPGGKIKFGIRRGTLKLNLANCSLPLDKVGLCDTFQQTIGVEIQEEIAKEIQIGVSASGTVGEKPSATGSGTAGWKTGDKTTQKHQFVQWQVHKTGGEQNPRWQFEQVAQKGVLKGTMKRESLGTISGQATPYQLIATFGVEASDVKLTWGNIVYTKDITRSKLAIIERLIAMQCIQENLNGQPLSEVRWQHG